MYSHDRDSFENDSGDKCAKRKVNDQELKSWNEKENSKQDEDLDGHQAKKIKSEASKSSISPPSVSPNEVVFKTSKIDDSTQFVLGKSANDLYLQFQQMASNMTNDDEATDSRENEQDDMQDYNSNKNIYSKHPNLFKYEADANDRLWLKENGILKRKNNKCYILLSAEVASLFQAKFFNRHSSSSMKEQFAKKLKTFGLTGKMVEKVKRKYSFHCC